jgi:hypothetical protein
MLEESILENVDGKKGTYNIVLVRSDFIRPTPEKEIGAGREGVEATIPENSAGCRANEGCESHSKAHT